MCIAAIPNNIPQERYERRSGQLIFPTGIEALIPEDDMVRFFAREYDRLDYSGLYEVGQSSGVGRPRTDPRLLFQICAFAYANDLYSARKIEEACRKRIDFIWLLDGAPAPDHTTIANFRSGVYKEAIEELLYQHTRYLDLIGVMDHKVGIIDGTKIESFANKYTFVWRKSIEKHLEKLKQKAVVLLERIGIRGEETKEALKTAVTSTREEMAELGIVEVQGTGHRKSQQQRDLEEVSEMLGRWEAYEEHLRIMGPDRNSYSKTDPDATFHRMKDDHMRNGQLKPGYNVQVCVNSEFIAGIKVYDDRNDVNTLKPFMEMLAEKHGSLYEIVVADAGYESLSNYKFMDEAGMESYVKPTNYEQMKTKKFKQQIGRRENMIYDEAGDFYMCANQQRLNFAGEHTFTPKNGEQQTNRVYRCENCVGCAYRQKCCKSKDVDKPKEIELNLEFIAYREKSLANITTDYGIQLRINRSIQVEGVFGIIKEDHHFRRFLCGGKDKVMAELHLLAIGYNIRKHYRKTMDNRLGTHLFEVKEAS